LKQKTVKAHPIDTVDAGDPPDVYKLQLRFKYETRSSRGPQANLDTNTAVNDRGQQWLE
jgi:hypothetical protein